MPVFFQGQAPAGIMWDNVDRKPAYYALQRALAEDRPGGQRYDRKPAYSN